MNGGRGAEMVRRLVSRVLVLGVLAAPLSLALSATPAFALACAPGDIVIVKVTATPSTVPSGGQVTVVFKGLNCTDMSQTVMVASKRFSPDPCGNASSTDPVAFAPRQLRKNTLTFAPGRCPGRWRFTLVAFQGSTQISKSWADFTAL